MARRSKLTGIVPALAGAGLLALTGGCGTSAGAGAERGPIAGTTAFITATTTARAHPPRTRRRAPKRGTYGARPAAIGRPSKTSGCRIRGQLPDPACTPGGVLARATTSQVCTPGYAVSVRNVPESVKRRVYAAYGIASHTAGSYEVDHLVSLELGGDNSAANLWPEVSPGYREKDRIEDELHAAVCAGRVSLGAAQRQIARDWRHTVVGAPEIVPAHRRPTAPPPARPSPATRVVHPGAFCVPVGARGVTSRGTPMTCARTATDPWARWRHAR